MSNNNNISKTAIDLYSSSSSCSSWSLANEVAKFKDECSSDDATVPMDNDNESPTTGTMSPQDDDDIILLDVAFRMRKSCHKGTSQFVQVVASFQRQYHDCDVSVVETIRKQPAVKQSRFFYNNVNGPCIFRRVATKQEIVKFTQDLFVSFQKEGSKKSPRRNTSVASGSRKDKLPKKKQSNAKSKVASKTNKSSSTNALAATNAKISLPAAKQKETNDESLDVGSTVYAYEHVWKGTIIKVEEQEDTYSTAGRRRIKSSKSIKKKKTTSIPRYHVRWDGFAPSGDSIISPDQIIPVTPQNSSFLQGLAQNTFATLAVPEEENGDDEAKEQHTVAKQKDEDKENPSHRHPLSALPCHPPLPSATETGGDDGDPEFQAILKELPLRVQVILQDRFLRWKKAQQHLQVAAQYMKASSILPS